ncbi:MAG: hypothetical protein WC186_06150 [Bacteroidales bacterium]
MKCTNFSIFFTILMIPMLADCHSSKETAENNPIGQSVSKPIVATNTTSVAAMAPILIYKTMKDYSQYVPVIMNAEKTKIVTYPDPTDVYYGGKLAYPTPLNNGYFLDNRGIGANVAFLNYTYEAYSRLKTAPTMEQLMNSLLDKSPLLELWNCGTRDGNKEEVNRLNTLIEKGFPGCKQLVKMPKVYMAP